MSLTQLRSRGILDGTISAGDLASGVGGKVLQVVQSTLTGSAVSTTSTSFVASGLIASVTPSSASNKILLNVSGHGMYLQGGTGGSIDVAIYKQIASGGYSQITASSFDYCNYDLGSENITPHSFTYLYSPNTTSQVDIQPYFRKNPNASNSVSFFHNHHFSTGYGQSVLTLMEIAG
jgi:hypothetical protein